MDWVILIVAGLFETAFAFCLGKMKGKKGRAYRLWAVGFVGCLAVSMWLLAVAAQTLPIPCGRASARWARSCLASYVSASGLRLPVSSL